MEKPSGGVRSKYHGLIFITHLFHLSGKKIKNTSWALPTYLLNLGSGNHRDQLTVTGRMLSGWMQARWFTGSLCPSTRRVPPSGRSWWGSYMPPTVADARCACTMTTLVTITRAALRICLELCIHRSATLKLLVCFKAFTGCSSSVLFQYAWERDNWDPARVWGDPACLPYGILAILCHWKGEEERGDWMTPRAWYHHWRRSNENMSSH